MSRPTRSRSPRRAPRPKSVAAQLFDIYDRECQPPAWSLRQHETGGEMGLDQYLMKSVVYYRNGADRKKVWKVATEREPVNMALDTAYDQAAMDATFGWRTSGYSAVWAADNSQLPPHIAVYNHTPMEAPLGSGRFVDVHVMNLVGLAFDDPRQPDAQYFGAALNVNDLVQLPGDDRAAIAGKNRKFMEMYRHFLEMWIFSFEAAIKNNLRNVAVMRVGGGFFGGALVGALPFGAKVPLGGLENYTTLYDFFYFETANAVYAAYTARAHANGKTPIALVSFTDGTHPGVSIKGETSGRVPQIFAELSPDVVRTTLFCNAWDPHSLPGNGNAGDDSADGFFGRASAIALLSFEKTNPFLRNNLKAVEVIPELQVLFR